jgi:hypothetical protein
VYKYPAKLAFTNDANVPVNMARTTSAEMSCGPE